VLKKKKRLNYIWVKPESDLDQISTRSLTSFVQSWYACNNLLDQLSKQSDYVYNVFLDNLFTSHKLLLYLRKKDYEITETARSNFEIYKNFVQLKIQDKKWNKILWERFKMMIISDNQIMQFIWKDNSVILFQSIMFDDQVYIIRDRKRFSRTFINAKTARTSFNNKFYAMLLISNFDDVYNHYMRAVDQTDQLRSVRN